MIVGRTIAAVVAAVALATATMLCVATATLALYWVLEPLVGRAGAAGLIAGLLALIVIIVVLVVLSRATSHRAQHHQEAGPFDMAFVDRLIEMAKDRPILSIGAALAAGLIVIRNPALVTALVAAFIDRPKRD